MSKNFSIDALLNNTNHENKNPPTLYINPLFQTFLNQLQQEQTKSSKLIFLNILFLFLIVLFYVVNQLSNSLTTSDSDEYDN